MENGMTLRERLAALGILADCEARCLQYGVTVDEAFGQEDRRRYTHLCQARWSVWHALSSAGWTSQAIGAATGYHYTTVGEGIRRFAKGKPAKEKARAGGRLGGGEHAPDSGKEEETTCLPVGQSEKESAP